MSRFNTYLSRCRISSEHAIGFYKSRFQFAKGVRYQIRSFRQLELLQLYVQSSLVLHMFAYDDESQDRTWDFDQDVFHLEGQRMLEEEDRARKVSPQKK